MENRHFIERSCKERKDKSRARWRTGKRQGKRSDDLLFEDYDGLGMQREVIATSTQLMK